MDAALESRHGGAIVSANGRVGEGAYRACARRIGLAGALGEPARRLSVADGGARLAGDGIEHGPDGPPGELRHVLDRGAPGLVIPASDAFIQATASARGSSSAFVTSTRVVSFAPETSPSARRALASITAASTRSCRGAGRSRTAVDSLTTSAWSRRLKASRTASAYHRRSAGSRSTSSASTCPLRPDSSGRGAEHAGQRAEDRHALLADRPAEPLLEPLALVERGDERLGTRRVGDGLDLTGHLERPGRQRRVAERLVGDDRQRTRRGPPYGRGHGVLRRLDGSD